MRVQRRKSISRGLTQIGADMIDQKAKRLVFSIVFSDQRLSA